MSLKGEERIEGLSLRRWWNGDRHKYREKDRDRDRDRDREEGRKEEGGLRVPASFTPTPRHNVDDPSEGPLTIQHRESSHSSIYIVWFLQEPLTKSLQTEKEFIERRKVD
uniref:Uncharacterized protein n=1 Tax=Vespula pensylvanica TaxID=30213 RepID=A0A834PGQ1_VESPE|nr:hypothetical protein H0235_001785 [Vespula pensylvanica]